MPITMENNVIHITRLLRYRELRGIPAGATPQIGVRSLDAEKDSLGGFFEPQENTVDLCRLRLNADRRLQIGQQYAQIEFPELEINFA